MAVLSFQPCPEARATETLTRPLIMRKDLDRGKVFGNSCNIVKNIFQYRTVSAIGGETFLQGMTMKPSGLRVDHITIKIQERRRQMRWLGGGGTKWSLRLGEIAAVGRNSWEICAGHDFEYICRNEKHTSQHTHHFPSYQGRRPLENCGFITQLVIPTYVGGMFVTIRFRERGLGTSNNVDKYVLTRCRAVENA